MTPSSDLEVRMDFDPEEGIPNLDEHLDRLKRDAEAQGFKFDRHAARNELQAATFGKSRRAVARLLVSPSGAIAIEVTAASE
jgi:para-aminobenzoate synthetase/4-amino-4-deoxychorismate lyase